MDEDDVLDYDLSGKVIDKNKKKEDECICGGNCGCNITQIDNQEEEEEEKEEETKDSE